jgi:DNA-directed RNA polymerase subunit RPC12/RpoP
MARINYSCSRCEAKYWIERSIDDLIRRPDVHCSVCKGLLNRDFMPLNEDEYKQVDNNNEQPRL